MRFGLLQMALGVALVAGAVQLEGAAWALAWPGLAVFVVGVAYLGDRHGVFGKSGQTGALAWAPRFVLLPYHVVAWTLWQIKSRVQGESPCDEVAPGVWVGRRPLHAGELPEGLAVVVDLTSEFGRSPHTLERGRYVAIPTLDTAAPPDAEMRAALQELEGEAGPVLFHCAMGHGRSATAAAALLVRRGVASDLEGALAQMTAARPKIHLHRAQRDAVRRLTDDAAEDRPHRAPGPA